MTTRTKKFVIHAFQAADLDGNKKINHNEFVTLFRHIEARKFEFRAALDLFEEAADIITKEEKNLSFDKFTALCVNQQLFSEES
jgi:Ca2+-binding EF-hand superfamily protein